MEPLISIIIPVYNCEKYIGQCLDSILNQKYRNFEIIAVNDGSTDNSLEVIRSWSAANARITVIDKKNEGVSIARNTGIKNAHGKYVCFIDADDWIELDYLTNLVEAIEKENADISKCGCKFISEFNNRIRTRHVPNITCTGKKAYESFLRGQGWLSSSCSALYSIDFLRSNQIYFPENVKIGEDGIFTMRALQLSRKIISIDIPLLNVRVREMSATRTGITYSLEHQYVDLIGSSVDQLYRECFKLRVLTSNLLRTAYHSNLNQFIETYNKATLDGYSRFNRFSKRRKLNLIFHFTSLLGKNKYILFFFVKTIKKLGYHPLF